MLFLAGCHAEQTHGLWGALLENDYIQVYAFKNIYEIFPKVRADSSLLDGRLFHLMPRSTTQPL